MPFEELFQGIGNIIPTFDIWGMLAIFMVLVVGFLIWFLKPWKKYNISIKVEDKYSDVPVVRFIKARRIKDRMGGQQYELKDGTKIPAQSFKIIKLTEKGKPFLELDEIEKGRFVPHGHSLPDGNLKLSYDDITHLVTNLKNNFDRFKSGNWWKDMIIPMMVIMIIFINVLALYVEYSYVLQPQSASMNAAITEWKTQQEIERNQTILQMQFLERMYTKYLPQEPIPVP